MTTIQTSKIQTHVPGFSRLGAARELPRALERHARGELSSAELEQTGRQLRARHWTLQREAGLDWVTVGDFAFHDQVMNHIELLGCAPARFDAGPGQAPLERQPLERQPLGRQPLQRQAAMARGAHALDKAPWFDTDDHYRVPELSPATRFALASERLFDEVREAQALGHPVKAMLLGPLSFLWLGRESAGFDRLALIGQLLPVYGAILDRLKQLGVPWVQIDEPILGLDLPNAWRSAFEAAYWQLNQVGVPLLLATYFSPLEENLSLTCRLPVAGLHVDGVRAAHELTSVNDWLPRHKVLSVGIVDGRNIWRTDLDAALAVLRPILEKRGGACGGELWLASSCSLQHVPFSFAHEAERDPQRRAWLACATEKLAELAILKGALDGSGHPADLAPARSALASRAAAIARVHTGTRSIALDQATLGPGLPLRRGQRDGYPAWVARVLGVGAGSAA